jgi:hypothetical protein
VTDDAHDRVAAVVDWGGARPEVDEVGGALRRRLLADRFDHVGEVRRVAAERVQRRMEAEARPVVDEEEVGRRGRPRGGGQEPTAELGELDGVVDQRRGDDVGDVAVDALLNDGDAPVGQWNDRLVAGDRHARGTGQRHERDRSLEGTG